MNKPRFPAETNCLILSEGQGLTGNILSLPGYEFYVILHLSLSACAKSRDKKDYFVGCLNKN